MTPGFARLKTGNLFLIPEQKISQIIEITWHRFVKRVVFRILILRLKDIKWILQVSPNVAVFGQFQTDFRIRKQTNNSIIIYRY